jgi:hypothetical protein
MRATKKRAQRLNNKMLIFEVAAVEGPDVLPPRCHIQVYSLGNREARHTQLLDRIKKWTTEYKTEKSWYAEYGSGWQPGTTLLTVGYNKAYVVTCKELVTPIAWGEVAP